MVSLYSLLLLISASCSLAARTAWNGHTTPDASRKSKFTPFYVPPGCKSYDSASRLITYSGSWSTIVSPSYISGSIQRTNEKGSSFYFAFTGTGIEWFGNCDRTHGRVKVFIDGQEYPEHDLFCDSDHSLTQQRLFWNFNLPHGAHILKVVNLGVLSVRSPGLKNTTKVNKGLMDVDALVVTRGKPNINSTDAEREHHKTKAKPKARELLVDSHQDYSLPKLGDPNLTKENPKWKLTLRGTTGVAAMQLAIISPSHAIIIDKVEHNPLTISGHPAWAALYNLKTHAIKPLRMQSNSFCAGGSFLGNGTLVNVGGNPVVEDYTSAADFGDLDGLQAIRLFHPCSSDTGEGCEIIEDHDTIKMTSPRWYPSVTRLQDGSVMIMGGSKKGGWINNATVNNPTIEYFPTKGLHGSGGLPIELPFLKDTLNSNLFPISFLLPDGRIFVAANNDAMIYDWERNVEQRLPSIPNGVRVTYPMAGTGLLLPLKPEDDYVPEILLCGGSTISDRKAPHEISAKDTATTQCSRIMLTASGIAQGWKVEQMPEPRIMPDAVLLPTGQIVMVNGAGSGISGYANVMNQVGQSNADNPVLTPVVYDPEAPVGQRFYRDESMPTSVIPRMYHSVASLTPMGNVMITGSNPNLDRSVKKFGTEYRVEWLEPPYMQMMRPVVKSCPSGFGFGEKFEIELGFVMRVEQGMKVVLMDLGFVTHSVHSNSRFVYLKMQMGTNRTKMDVFAPPNGKVYPPGPGWIFVVVDGVPSEGVKVMVGNGLISSI